MKKIKKSRVEKKEQMKSFLFIVPSLIGVIIFFVVPFFVVFYYSMIDNPINKEFVFFDNFIILAKNKAFTLAAWNTLKFSLIVLPLAVIIPLFLAMLLMKKIPGKSAMRSILISPLMVPVASIVLIWEVLFHYNGVINSFMEKLGFEIIDWFKSEHSLLVIIVLFLWKNVGYNMIMFMAALGNIPVDSIEAAKIDGAGRVRTFIKIQLPYMSSSILFVTILSLINSFKIFREVYLLTGKYPYETMFTVQHYMNNTFESLDYQKLSCAAVYMLVVMIVLIGIFFAVDARAGRDIEE